MSKNSQTVKAYKETFTKRDRNKTDKHLPCCQYNTKVINSTQETAKTHDTLEFDGDYFLRLYRDRKLSELSKLLDRAGFRSVESQIFMLNYLSGGAR